MENFSPQNRTPKIEPPSQMTHFGTPRPERYTKRDGHFSQVRQCFVMDVMQLTLAYKRSEGVEIDPLNVYEVE